MSRVAIVHDWLTGMRGGERCLEAFLTLYPDADLYTLLHLPGSTSPKIEAAIKGTSFLQRLPKVASHYRFLLPLFPAAARSLKLDGYETVISLSHAAAKNVAVPPGTRHLSYCFTPMRYIWDQAHVYFGKLTPIIWPLIKHLRSWDVEGAKRIDKIAGISDFVSARIRCYYGIRAETIYPPVTSPSRIVTNHPTRGARAEKGCDAFLYAGALVKYKRVDSIIKAFNRSGHSLWIVGDGPQAKSLKKIAAPNIHFFGYLSDAELAECYAHCRALVFAGVEDFGMVPVECLSLGKPVIGLDAGGMSEILSAPRHWLGESFNKDRHCGIFIKNSTVSSLEDEILSSLGLFIKHEEDFVPEVSCKRAELFSYEVFRQRWLDFAESSHGAKIDGAKIACNQSFA